VAAPHHSFLYRRRYLHGLFYPPPYGARWFTISISEHASTSIRCQQCNNMTGMTRGLKTRNGWRGGVAR